MTVEKLFGQETIPAKLRTDADTAAGSETGTSANDVNAGVLCALKGVRGTNLWEEGRCMRKMISTLIIASLVSATSVAPAYADGWRGHHGGVFNPLWPVAVALSIPAAIIGTVANAVTPVPVGYGYAAPPAPVAYSGYPTYYAPGAYYAPRVYVAPRGYYGYPAYRVHRVYGRGW